MVFKCLCVLQACYKVLSRFLSLRLSDFGYAIKRPLQNLPLFPPTRESIGKSNLAD